MQVSSENNKTANQHNRAKSLDARTRMIICLTGSVAVILFKEVMPLSILLVASIIYALFQKRFYIMAICYGAVILMGITAFFCLKIMIIFMPEMGTFKLSLFFIPFLRVAIMVNVILALALSSRIQDILTSLKSLHLPFFIYLPASVMIRFIPGFINDIKLVSQSLKIRGYTITPVSFALHPFMTTRLLFVPVIVRALRLSDELAVAAELKGVGYSEKTTCFRVSNFLLIDYIAWATVFTLLLLACMLEYHVWNF